MPKIVSESCLVVNISQLGFELIDNNNLERKRINQACEAFKDCYHIGITSEYII